MKKLFILFSFVEVIQIILAIICGPHSCEWGNNVYFYSGIAAIAISIFLPFTQKNLLLKWRVGYAFLLPVISVVLWLAGFMLFGFRIICRLF